MTSFRFLGAGLVLAAALTFSCQGGNPGGAEADRLRVEVSVDKTRPKPGETVRVSAVVRTSDSIDEVDLKAVFLVPTKGPRDLTLKLASRALGLFKGEIRLAADAPQGFYGITISSTKPSAPVAGKASFVVGKVVGDFMIVSAMPETGAEADTADYMREFTGIGGNMLVVHDIINKKAWYPSTVCAVAAQPHSTDDRVGLTLDLADRFGLPSLVTVVWDTTKKMPYADYMDSMKVVMRELWRLYGSHPSLIGFYDYQEGSGTYLAGQVREFCDAVKALNKGLLSGCAPYIDDPLLAGYLAAIDSLDIVVYQGAVMASYRPDNRKLFPARRTKDFAALSAGAMLPKGKMALSHVELFGYLEKSFGGRYLAGPEDASDQLLSAASAFGPDGLTLFTYHGNIHAMGKKTADARKTGAAVESGLKAYSILAREVADESGHIGVYIPYSDWWAERWTESIVPALDAFRRLGLAAEIIPFIPPKGEEILPYYPYHMNEEQLEYLLSRKYILVLPDVAGMQDTDSLLLKTFIERGGTALLFGPRIPYGDLFDRQALVGGVEEKAKRHALIEMGEPLFARVKKGMRFAFGPADAPSWKPGTGKIVAAFEDGSAAALVNAFGKGAVVTISLDLASAARIMPAFVRDVLDFALARHGLKKPFDIDGLAEDMDVAMTTGGGAPAAAVMNYGPRPVDVSILPLSLEPGRTYSVTDLKTGARISRKGNELFQLAFRVNSHDFVAIKIKGD
ncbi:MAG: hypothetical protein ABSF88_12790 [Candidatus Aminicenantales bacterium]